MTNFAWSFPQFDVAKAEDGLTDVIKTIHWRYDAQDGSFSAGAYGSIGLSAPDPSSFVPYTQITAMWAIDCVTAQVKMDELNAALETQIANQKNPPTMPMVPPFTAL
jgi:hypothetical protein